MTPVDLTNLANVMAAIVSSIGVRELIDRSHSIFTLLQLAGCQESSVFKKSFVLIATGWITPRSTLIAKSPIFQTVSSQPSLFTKKLK